MSEFIEDMQSKLEEKKREILQNLRLESNEFNDLMKLQGPKDLADLAADDIDLRVLDLLSAREIRRLNQIDSALARIHSGHYGNCLKCGSSISRNRLLAIPYALVCISCKNQLSKK